MVSVGVRVLPFSRRNERKPVQEGVEGVVSAAFVAGAITWGGRQANRRRGGGSESGQEGVIPVPACKLAGPVPRAVLRHLLAAAPQ